jgi:hypothetical protein
MNAHKVEITLSHNGMLTLEGLPFHAGEMVEVIILERSDQQQTIDSHPTSSYPLRGKVIRYDDPLEPAV